MRNEPSETEPDTREETDESPPESEGESGWETQFPEEEIPDFTIDPVADLSPSESAPKEPSAIEPAESESIEEAAPAAAMSRIADVIHHRARKGESRASIAGIYGLDPQELARFNWKATTDEEIRIRLENDLGCPSPTEGGVDHTFDGTENPGVPRVPRDWRIEKLETARTHVVRLRRMTGTRTVLSLVLYDDEWSAPLPHKPYEIRGPNDQSLVGETDAHGALFHGPVPLGYYEIRVREVWIGESLGEVRLQVPAVPESLAPYLQRLPLVRPEVDVSKWIPRGSGGEWVFRARPGEAEA